MKINKYLPIFIIVIVACIALLNPVDAVCTDNTVTVNTNINGAGVAIQTPLLGAAAKITKNVGETWDIGNGYTLEIQSINEQASPHTATLVFGRNGTVLDSKVVQQGQSYSYENIFSAYIDSIFVGPTSSLVQFRDIFFLSEYYLWGTTYSGIALMQSGNQWYWESSYINFSQADTWKVSYGGVEGYLTPANETKNAAGLNCIEFTGNYIGANIMITTNIADASFTISGPGGYSKSGSGTSWNDNNVAGGSYSVTFNDVSGYTTPAAQSKSISPGSTAYFSANYALSPTITPTPTTIATQTTTPPTPQPTLTISSSSTAVTVGMATNVTFTVTSGGVPVSFATVILSGSASGSGTTDVSGNVVISVNPTTPGTITATASMPEYVNGSTSLSANPSPIPAWLVLILIIILVLAAIMLYLWTRGNLKLIPKQTSIPSDGKSTLPIKVQFVNAFGKPRKQSKDREIEMETTSGKIQNIVIPAGKESAEATLTSSTECGTVTITAKSGKQKATAQVSFISKEIGLDIEISPTEIPADGKSTATATIKVKDDMGNYITSLNERTVELTITLGTITSPVRIPPKTLAGTATITSGQISGAAIITASSGQLKGEGKMLFSEIKKRYCPHCGASISMEAKSCPKCGKDTFISGEDTKQCSTCGAIIPLSAKFCSECGARQPM